MSRLKHWTVCLPALVLAAGTCLAQNPEPARFYRLDFVVKEVEGGKVLNARSYSMTVSTYTTNTGGSGEPSRPAQIRTGSRVPVATGKPASQYTYIDVGVNIDCSAIKQEQNELSLNVTADLSTVAQESAPSPDALPPVIRQNKWASRVIVPIKKPTVIFSSDDMTSKRQMQLELTATPIRD